MATALNVTTSVSGVGVSGTWTSSTTNTEGHLLSEPAPAATLHLAAAAPTYTIKYTSSTLYNSTGSVFTFTAEPTTWSPLTTGQTFTVYWTDASGNQQYAYGVTMDPSGTFPARTWTTTNVAYGGASTAPTDGQSNSGQTTMFGVVIAPETADAAVTIPGSDGTTAQATPVLAQMFATSSRTGLIVLKDSNSTPNKVPLLVGPYAGTCWTGSGTNPISTLCGSGGGSGTANKGASNAVYSTADTAYSGTINVVWYTDS